MKRLKLRKLFMICGLAVAGIFGAGSILINKQGNKNALVQEVDAAAPDVDNSPAIFERVHGVKYRVIYYHINTDWEKGNRFVYYSSDSDINSKNHCFVYTYNEVEYTNWFGRNNSAAGENSFSEIIGDWAAKIYLPYDLETIDFRSSYNLNNGTRSRQRHTGNISLGNNAGFVITTNNWSDWGEGADYQTASGQTKDSFEAYFNRCYFTVTSEWNGGNKSLTSDWICTNWSSGRRSIQITSSMIRAFEDGRKYAEYLCLKTASWVCLANNSSNYWGNSAGTQLSSNDGVGKIYTLTTNVSDIYGTTQTATFVSFPSEGTDYDIVGTGSFLTNPEYPWSYLGGINLKSDDSDHGVLTNQYFIAGDIFQIKNRAGETSDYWYGYSKYQSGVTNFSRTILSEDKGTVECYVEGQPSWWANAGCVTRIITLGSSTASHNQTIDLTGVSGKFTMYSDVTTIKFCRHNSDGNYNEITASLPSDWSSSCNWYIYEQDSVLKTSRTNRTTGNNIKVETTGFYNIYLNSSDNIYISNSLGQAVYLDLGTKASEWEDADALIGAYFWKDGSSTTGDATSYMRKVQGIGNDTTYEALVPKLSWEMPDRVVFFRANPSNPSEWWNQGVDLTILPNNNKYKLDGGKDGSSHYTGSWQGLVTYEDRANYFGTYFTSASGVVCYNAINKPTGWNNAEIEYSYMCKGAQQVAYEAKGVEGTIPIENAMARYDLIVSRYGTEEYLDYINRTAAGSGSSILHGAINHNGNVFNPFGIKDENSFSTIIIIIASSISLLSITALSVLVIKKRKTK